MADTKRIVDIFSGCGGLSLGFDLLGRGEQFRTVLAVDIDGDAVAVLNGNHRRLHGGAALVASAEDLSAFRDVHEVRAFYLEKLASLPEYRTDLGPSVRGLGLEGLRADVEALDQVYFSRVTRLVRTREFRRAADAIDRRTRTSTLFRAFLDRFGLPALGGGFRSRPTLGWSAVDPREEAVSTFVERERGTVRHRGGEKRDRYFREKEGEWVGALDHLKELLEERSPDSIRFFETDAFREMQAINLTWRARRHRRIAEFFDDAAKCRRVDALYTRYRAHGLLGAPPCQGFSNAGRSKLNGAVRDAAHTLQDEEFGDRRNGLFRAYLLFLEALAPDFFVFENVPRFESSVQLRGERRVNVEEMLRAELEGITRLPYCAEPRLVHAHLHGLPQRRSRYLLVGFRIDRFPHSPSETFAKSLELGKVRTSDLTPCHVAFDGLSAAGTRVAWVEHGSRSSPESPVDGPDPARLQGAGREYARFIRTAPRSARKRVAVVTDHWARRPNEQDEPLFGQLREGDHWGRIPRVDLRKILVAIARDHHLLKYLPKKAASHKDWLARMDGKGLSRTICAHLAKDGYAYIHPTQPRSISVREAARLQGFPDWFSFRGVSMSSAFRMIGNAFPPFVARQIAQAVRDALDEGKSARVAARSARAKRASRSASAVSGPTSRRQPVGVATR